MGRSLRFVCTTWQQRTNQIAALTNQIVKLQSRGRNKFETPPQEFGRLLEFLHFCQICLRFCTVYPLLSSAMDVEAKTLYWVDAMEDTIESISINGDNRLRSLFFRCYGPVTSFHLHFELICVNQYSKYMIINGDCWYPMISNNNVMVSNISDPTFVRFSLLWRQVVLAITLIGPHNP